MPEQTADCVTPPWVHPPTPDTPSHRLIDAEADLMAASEAEIHQAPTGTDLMVLARVQHLITGATR